MREAAGADRLQRHVAGLLGYLERNAGALVPYAARRRRGEPISTAFVESAVNEIVAKRMNKILWANGWRPVVRQNAAAHQDLGVYRTRLSGQ